MPIFKLTGSCCSTKDFKECDKADSFNQLGLQKLTWSKYSWIIFMIQQFYLDLHIESINMYLKVDVHNK